MMYSPLVLVMNLHAKNHVPEIYNSECAKEDSLLVLYKPHKCAKRALLCSELTNCTSYQLLSPDNTVTHRHEQAKSYYHQTIQ